jgi:hypothetical protein
MLGALPEERVERNREALVRICMSHFAKRKLLGICEKGELQADVICGLSRFVWLCDRRVLAGAEVHYPALYNAFKKAPGEARLALVVVCMAIREATGKSIVEMPGIDKLHVDLISRMVEQFAPQAG